MKAIAYDEFGGPDVLGVHDLPDPEVGPDYVLVRVAAAGVNPVDAKAREGALAGAFPFAFPVIPGWDVAGTVVSAGPAQVQLVDAGTVRLEVEEALPLEKAAEAHERIETHRTRGKLVLTVD